MDKQRQLPMPGPGGPGGGGRNNMSRVNGEKPKHTLETLKRLTKYIGRSKYVLIALLALTLLIALVDLTGPLLQGNAIDAIEAVYYNAETYVEGGANTPLYNYDAKDPQYEGMQIRTEFKVHWHREKYEGQDGYTNGMIFNLVLMGILFAVSAVLNYFMGILAAMLSQRTVYTMRNDLFRKISRLPISYLDSHKHGDVMSRITNDVENVSNAISSSITLLFSGLLTIVGAFIMMLILSPVMTLVAMVTIPLSIFVSSRLILGKVSY